MSQAKSARHVIAPEDRISLSQKFFYSMGSLANDSQAAWIGQMVAILILGLGINPIWVGLIGAVPRIFDAVLDPVLGFTSDNARTKYGRRRPFIFFGAIAAGICYMFMFQLYPENGPTFNAWYFLILQIIFFGAFTCYSIPWIALGYEMTPDYHERTSLQSWSRVFAQVPWLLSPWCWAIMYSFKNPETGAPDQVLGARTAAIIIGAVIIGAGILPAIFNKEHFANLPAPKKITGDFAKNILKDVRSVFVVKLLAICALITIAGQFFVPLSGITLLSRVLILAAVVLVEAVFFLFLNAIPMVRKMFE
ncbi:MAG: MFS transporter, partial [Elusimicrobia bacterium]|nr:MFS transporter [Elusimicrobiota bacterium]